MFERLRNLLWPKPPVKLRQIIDFRYPRIGHWARFDGGDNFDARFTVRGKIALHDDIIVRMQSGRSGRYRVFSRQCLSASLDKWRIGTIAIGYWEDICTKPKPVTTPATSIKGLLGDGPGWVRSDKGELAHIPSSLAKSSGDFWKILCRDEACHQRTGSRSAASNL